MGHGHLLGGLGLAVLLRGLRELRARVDVDLVGVGDVDVLAVRRHAAAVRRPVLRALPAEAHVLRLLARVRLLHGQHHVVGLAVPLVARLVLPLVARLVALMPVVGREHFAALGVIALPLGGPALSQVHELRARALRPPRLLRGVLRVRGGRGQRRVPVATEIHGLGARQLHAVLGMERLSRRRLGRGGRRSLGRRSLGRWSLGRWSLGRRVRWGADSMLMRVDHGRASVRMCASEDNGPTGPRTHTGYTSPTRRKTGQT